MSATPEIYATITAVDTPSAGWYQAEININPGFIVSGTSLKGSSFTVGEKVRIFQFLFWGSGAEFGFAKESEMEYSVCQFNQAFFEGVRNQNPHGFLLNWIAQKANNKKQMFGAGKIHSFITYPGIGNIGARVDLVSSSTRAILGFAADLNPNEFNLDDGVLVSYWPNPGRTIEGWWQTVKGASGGTIRIGDAVLFAVQFQVTEGLGAQIIGGRCEILEEEAATFLFGAYSSNPAPPPWPQYDGISANLSSVVESGSAQTVNLSTPGQTETASGKYEIGKLTTFSINIGASPFPINYIVMYRERGGVQTEIARTETGNSLSFSDTVGAAI